MNSLYPYISIEGNIGAGKTTLVKSIAERFNGKIILESFDDNPFLPRFYEDPRKHAFPLEMFFLAERYRQLSDELQGGELFHDFIISDYYLEKSLIYARNNLDEDEFSLFSRLYSIMFQQLPKPDLLVYLMVPMEKLRSHIVKRGRTYEQNISDQYLENIQNVYLDHLRKLDNTRIVLLNYGNLNFSTDPGAVDTIFGALNEKFPLGLTQINL